MRRVKVVYHYEEGAWWADSPSAGLETFVAGGRTLEETRQLAHEGAAFHLEDQVRVEELFDPQHVVTRFEAEYPAPVTVSGGPAPAVGVGARVTITPALPCAVAS